MKTIASRIIAAGDKLRPAVGDIFNAYRSTPLSQVKVVIVGQDPYPGNEAHGLSFSSKLPSVPPSLRIIFKELERVGYGTRTSPNLQDWADQGVLMLNSVLTTTYRIPNDHQKWGWQTFTKESLKLLNTLEQPIVYMAWGNYAQTLIKEVIPDTLPDNRLYLYACHPQAENYSGGKLKFVGCGHFTDANVFFARHRVSPIKWV
jgi:uracil-DNA glycosylase